MSSLPILKFSVSEYLDIDRAAELKSEFHDGEMFPIDAVSFAHSTIAANTVQWMGTRLQGSSCRVLVQPLRVRVSPTKFVYPDLMVVCGKPAFTDDDQDTITNPKVIVEVLSPSTANYDYGMKFGLYRSLASFTEYLLIRQDEPKVEVFRRLEGGDWLLSTYSGMEATVPVKSLEIGLGMAELYAGVEFDGAPA